MGRPRRRHEGLDHAQIALVQDHRDPDPPVADRCSARARGWPRGTVPRAKSQTLGPSITKACRRFASTSAVIGMRVPPAGTWMARLPRPSLPSRKWMRPSCAGRLRQQDGARAVAEEDARPPVAPVHDLGEGVRADDQGAPILRRETTASCSAPRSARTRSRRTPSSRRTPEQCCAAIPSFSWIMQATAGWD